MNRLFLSLQSIILFLRVPLYPILNCVPSLLNSSFKKRREFENLNLTDPCSRPFDGDVAFEVASEGELEQAWPLMEWLISRKKKVELIYASPSLQVKCNDLARSHPDLIRIFRLPLISWFPWGDKRQRLSQFVRAKKLILCRYDFYPELLLLGAKPNMDFILISAFERRRSVVGLWYRKSIYRLFNTIVATNTQQRKKIIKWGLPEKSVFAFDFRVIRIAKRLEKTRNTLSTHPFFSLYESLLVKTEKKNRLIMGSAWPVDMGIFADKQLAEHIQTGKIQAMIVPHRLHTSFIEKIEKELNLHGIPSQTIPPHCTHAQMENLLKLNEKTPGVFILSIPGILCELYTLFGTAWIGGGHGASVHSLLEPFLAHITLYCGPRVERSSEYHFIREKSPKSLVIVNKLKDFFSCQRENPSMAGASEITQALHREFEQLAISLMTRNSHVG